MKRRKRVLIVSAACILMMSALTGCGKHYCSYGGCMVEVAHEGDRCSKHAGLVNDPTYGIPKSWIK